MTYIDQEPRPKPPLAADEATAIVAALERQRATLAGRRVRRPSAPRPPAGRSPNLRRVLLDVLEEFARDSGRADIIRDPSTGRSAKIDPTDGRWTVAGARP